MDAEFRRQLASVQQDLSSFLDKYSDTYLGAIGENPHITRLVESFAFLQSRLYCALEDSDSSLVSSLIEFMYPHLNRPIPSMVLVNFALHKDQKKALYLERGTVVVMQHKETEVKFRLCYDTQVLPARVVSSTAAEIEDGFIAQEIAGARSSVSIKIEALGEKTFAELQLRRMRFMINANKQVAVSIYNSLFSAACKVVIKSAERGNGKVLHLNKNRIDRVGFNPKETVLPHEEKTFSGYLNLTEFFFYSSKFLFFDLLLEEGELEGLSKEIILTIYCTDTDLVHVVSQNSFVLNAAPLVNLCKTESDPVELVRGQSEYGILVNKGAKFDCSIYSIQDIKVGFGGKEVTARPISDSQGLGNKGILWHAEQKRMPDLSRGTTVSLILQKDAPQPSYMYAIAEYFNGDVPHNLYVTFKEQIKWYFLDNTLLISDVCVLAGPTKPRLICPTLGSKISLLTFLSTHYLNIADNINAKRMIKNLISMYDEDEASLAALITESIDKVTVENAIEKIETTFGCQFCNGISIKIYFKKIDQLPVGTFLLFCHVLDEFLAFYAPINSFIRLQTFLAEKSLYTGIPRVSNAC